MTTDVIQTVDVHTPVATAYNQWTQFESFPEFMNGVESVRQLDERHTHWVTKVGGVHREFDAEITEQRPDEVISWRSVDGDVAHAGRVTFQPLAADQTRVTVQLVWEPSGFTEKAGSMLGFDDRQVKSDVERFKEFIEQRGVETGAWRGEVPQPQATPDVIDLLRQQHEQIMAQFDQVRTASRPARQ